ncbi:hypothetical protein H2201_006196 [Coniosporium apollinis]|uniref:Ribonuclease H2 subunit B n=1 Tax=Coniosporium apollinis TaxID=61459 RepID=A0ABQ9NUH2_9PEZI|nr:hypothetical protein H2201_006196 [Coniosporium apollinis]
MKTRSRAPAKKSKEEGEEESITTSATLQPSETSPPRLFVLPIDTTPEARVVTLLNPATSTPNRYYFCPEKGFYEFTKIAAPRKTPRSWLLAPRHNHEKSACGETDVTSQEEQKLAKPIDAEAPSDNSEDISLSNGYIAKDADLYIATPLDPVFLLLPILAPPSTSAKDEDHLMFLSMDDHLDACAALSAHMEQLLRHQKLRAMVQERMMHVCDAVDAGAESMYRLSKDKLLKDLLVKARRLAENGLPASMEQKFVRGALETPVMNIRREESTISAVSIDIAEDAPSQDTDSQTLSGSATESQQTTDSAGSASTNATSVSSASTAAVETPSKAPIASPAGVAELLRIRTAFNFMAVSYLPPHLRPELQQMLASTKEIDFSPLDAHLEHLASLRSQAQALRSLSDNISRKRSAVEDEEAADARAEKKRKKEDEEKKKRTQSHGVRQLQKADTSGMKKLGAFFTKAPATKAAK